MSDRVSHLAIAVAVELVPGRDRPGPRLREVLR